MDNIFVEAAVPLEDDLGEISDIKAESVDGDAELDIEVRALLLPLPGGAESIAPKGEDVDDDDDAESPPPLIADPDDSSDEYDSDDDFDPDDDYFADEE